MYYEFLFNTDHKHKTGGNPKVDKSRAQQHCSIKSDTDEPFSSEEEGSSSEYNARFDDMFFCAYFNF